MKIKLRAKRAPAPVQVNRVLSDIERLAMDPEVVRMREQIRPWLYRTPKGVLQVTRNAATADLLATMEAAGDKPMTEAERKWFTAYLTSDCT